MTSIANVAPRPTHLPEPSPRGPDRRRFGPLALAAGARAAHSSLPAGALPASAEAQVVDFEWVDTSRDHALPARLYWPAAANQKGPIPLIVFTHVPGGSRKTCCYLGEGWSARGTASLHLQHVGNDQTQWEIIKASSGHNEDAEATA